MVHLDLGLESGDPRMLYQIAQGIKKEGHDITIYTAHFNAACFPALHAGLRIVAVDGPSIAAQSVERGSTIASRILARLSRNKLQDEGVERIKRILPRDLDILVCQNDRSYTLGSFYKTVNPKVHTVWIMNNAPFYSERKSNILLTVGSRVNAAIERWRVERNIRGVDLVVVHDEERRKLAASLGKPTILLPIPVDFESFYQSAKTRNPNDRHITLIGIGSLSPARKFEDIISAGAILKDKGYEARVILICNDVRRDRAYKKLLLDRANDNGMNDLVNFYFEGASEKKLRELLQAADFFVFPNHFNIWSMAAFESMAAGLPLIVSRITSVAEVIKDGTEAMVFDHGNCTQIAAAAESLVNDHKRYNEVAAAGQAMVKRELGWKAYIQRFLIAAEGK